MIRRAAVAGSFYSGAPERLRAQATDFIQWDLPKVRGIGAVVPHAGLIYSGKVAGSVYARLAFPDVFVILGPNHTGVGAGVAIMTYGRWETPLGQAPIDADLAKTILQNSQAIEEDQLGHQREHSIEVQLPLLQAFGLPFSFVPICLFSSEYAVCQDVGLAVAEAVARSDRSVLIVASTDMSHYISQDQAKAKDQLAIEAILACDPERLHRVVRREEITMCGFHPTTAMLIAARELGATSAELVGYATSADVTKDDSRVVGYAGLIVR
ncbi:AmmeMemoRadiSam system protein B [Candidatus Methylomirabilis sp.]|uniref:AmmeMemoRadiSam system protein B n=1 Tax=Candidatus Methylomirabilis sp. TaxID=2032687 RepID=UPI002A5FA80C|nr:AmmeMemoRadiSam system protein B [Candidatus Methylomirabilis sp.]